jgi:SAM-dependent methyltransferase
MTEDAVSRFYDDLAPHYHLICHDWDAAMMRQAGAISAILQRASGGSGSLSILDCACGIGTQSLGLAKLGYQVTGSDLSAGAVERARAEAAAREFSVPFYVADVRRLDDVPVGGFEAVISMDNALPHLLSDADLSEAARQIRGKLRTGGTLLASMHDSDQLLKDRATVQGPAFGSDAGRRRIIVQVWDWADDRRYTVHLYITQETPSGWDTFHGATVYRAVLREEFTAILAANGFANVRWLFPNESGLYLPVVMATAVG